MLTNKTEGLEDLSTKLKYEDGTLIWKVSPNRKHKEGSKAGTRAYNGYEVIRYKNKYYKAHRVVWYMFYKEEPKEIDHINGIRHDNRIENLRAATRSTNSQNQTVQKCKKSSQYKGVSYSNAVRMKNKWVAYITLNKKRTYLGSFSSEEEAALAYNKKAIELFGEFAKLNEVPNVKHLD